MLKRFLLLPVLIATVHLSVAQAVKDAEKYVAIISEEGLKDKLSILASDALEGRLTGSRGQKMAAAFIARHFETSGLIGPVGNSYFQKVPLKETKPLVNNLIINEQKYENYGDMFFLGVDHFEGIKSAPIVFAGLGKVEDLQKLDCRNKAVLILSGKLDNQIFSSIAEQATLLREKGAQAVVAIPDATEEEFNNYAGRIEGFLGNGMMALENSPAPRLPNVFFAKKKIAEEIFSVSWDKLSDIASGKSNKKLRESRIGWQNQTSTRNFTSENVLGYLEGTDKKDELVVVTAHFDHVGLTGDPKDPVFNGADDDGSGTAAVMQLAEAFTKAYQEGTKPRRSILFMTVTGEEEGLFGSAHYVANPVFPLSQTVVDLNIDMIGRSDPQHSTDNKYVYVIGSDKLSTELHKLHEQINTTYSGLTLDYTYNDEKHPEQLYYRSDHWNFAKNSIPIIFYFDGIHEDYHKATDEVSKIDFDALTKRTRLIFRTAWELANRENRPAIDRGR